MKNGNISKIERFTRYPTSGFNHRLRSRWICARSAGTDRIEKNVLYNLNNEKANQHYIFLRKEKRKKDNSFKKISILI